MIGAVYNFISFWNAPPTEENFFPHKRVQQAVYLFFTTISVCSTLNVYQIAGPSSFYTQPFVLLTLLFVYKFFTISDYHDLEKLKEYRKEAANQSLEEILQSHQLLNIIKYDILYEDSLNEKLKIYLSTLNNDQFFACDGQFMNAYLKLGEDQPQPVYNTLIDDNLRRYPQKVLKQLRSAH